MLCARSTFFKELADLLSESTDRVASQRVPLPQKHFDGSGGKMRNFRWKLHVGKEFQHFKDFFFLFKMQQSVSGTCLFAVEYLRCWSADA